LAFACQRHRRGARCGELIAVAPTPR
jgi:hypothetical protein